MVGIGERSIYYSPFTLDGRLKSLAYQEQKPRAEQRGAFLKNPIRLVLRERLAELFS